MLPLIKFALAAKMFHFRVKHRLYLRGLPQFHLCKDTLRFLGLVQSITIIFLFELLKYRNQLLNTKLALISRGEKK